MIFEKYLKIFIVLSSLILIPDLILSLSGRETYIIIHSSLFIDMGIFISFALFVIVVLEIVNLLKKKEWKTSLLICLSIVIVVFFCKIMINHLVNISIYEAEVVVSRFLNDSNSLNSKLEVSIDDKVKNLFDDFLTHGGGVQSMVLALNVPHLRLYDFKIIPNDSQPFFIRHTVSQSENDKIWIH